MAADREIPVLPVSVVYQTPKAAWVGDDFFVPHFLNIFKKTPLRARLAIGPVLCGNDGEDLQTRAHRCIASQVTAAEGGLPN